MWVGKFALSPEGLPAGGVAWVDLGTTAASSPAVVNGAAYHPTYSSPDGISALYVTTEAVAAADAYIGGFRYRSDGALRVYDATSAVPAGSNTNQGIALTSDGQLCYTTGNTTAFALNGVAVDTERRVYAAPLAFELQFADLGAGAVDTAEEVFDTTPTFTRATAATTVLSNGLIASVATGVARSYYDPTSLTYLGYLAEGAGTNLCLQSEDTATTWGPTNTTVTINSTVSPDGAITADLVLETVDNGEHYIEQTFTATAGTWTSSVWIKASGRSTCALVAVHVGETDATSVIDVDLSAGTIEASSGRITSTNIKSYPNGWYRCSITWTTTVACTSLRFRLQSTDAGTTVYVGDVTKGQYWWGAQQEAAAFASSYIPTTTAAVTRNADVLTYTFAASAPGTLLATFQVYALGTAANQIFLQTDDGTANERIGIYKGTTNIFTDFVIDGGSVESNNTVAGALSANTSYTGAVSYATNSVIAASSGTLSTEDLSATMPTVTTVRVGVDEGSINQIYGAIRRVAYYGARLANATLQGLTA